MSDWDFAQTYSVSLTLVCFVISGLVCYSILMLNEHNIWWRCSYAMSKRKMGTTNTGSMDPDVIKERDYVASLGATNIQVLNLVCRELCKSYDNLIAVNDVSLSIEG